MTIFNRLASSARAAHSAIFGTASEVTLSEPGSSPRIVTAVLGNSRTEERHEDSRTTRVTVRNCRFPTLSTVRHDATLTIGGQIWTVDSVGSRQASGLHVTLMRRDVNESARPSYRGKG